MYYATRFGILVSDAIYGIEWLGSIQDTVSGCLGSTTLSL